MKKSRLISSHDSLRRKAIAAIDERIDGLRLLGSGDPDPVLRKLCAFAKAELRAVRSEIRRLQP